MGFSMVARMAPDTLTHWVRCPILTHWVHGCGCLTLTHWGAVPPGAMAPGRGARCPSGAAALGSRGAGEGRRRVGHWQGGITEPVKNFSKIKNPLGH